ncbi:hypothetical protein RIF29_22506 [Crotalaria pallida]|uniref:Uncharacterized protein n=1 Tax=Crotalaria pallida TaxID=3830 RepID=A0AAN9IEI6_CROPI
MILVPNLPPTPPFATTFAFHLHRHPYPPPSPPFLTSTTVCNSKTPSTKDPTLYNNLCLSPPPPPSPTSTTVCNSATPSTKEENEDEGKTKPFFGMYVGGLVIDGIGAKECVAGGRDGGISGVTEGGDDRDFAKDTCGGLA